MRRLYIKGYDLKIPNWKISKTKVIFKQYSDFFLTGQLVGEQSFTWNRLLNAIIKIKTY